MSTRSEKIVCRASWRDDFFASSPRMSFSTATGQCTYRQSHPPLQFCWLRLLPNLLYIPKWRGSKETAVFAGELGAADIANVIRRSRRIHRLDQHEPPSFLQTKLLLILKGGHVGERLEMVVEPRRTHVRFLSDELYRKWLVKVLFQPADGLYDAAGIAVRLCHSLKLFALLATPQAVKNLPMQ